MNTVMDRNDFNSFVKRIVSEKTRFAAPAYRKLLANRMAGRTWAKEFGKSKAALIDFIALRSLGQGQAAAPIHMSAIIGHVPLCERTIRVHLAALVKAGIVYVYGMADSAHCRYQQAKVYALNCNRFQLQGIDPMSFLNAPKARRVPTSKFAMAEVPHGKHESGDEEQNLPRRTTRGTSDAVERVLAAADARQQAAVARKRTKVAALPVGAMSMASLQFQFDDLMAKYHPTLGRVLVTAKEFGLLRKRITAQKLYNTDHFFDWLIRSWRTIAMQQNELQVRQMRDGGKTYEAIPMAPNMKTIAFKFPYFAKVYISNLAGRTVTATDPRDLKIVALEKALAAQGKELNVVRTMRHSSRVAATSNTPRGPREIRARSSSDFAEWDDEAKQG